MAEYWKLIFWLARDVVTLFPRKVAMIQLSELASVGLGYAVGGVAFAVFYVLENGTVNVLGRTLSFAPTSLNLSLLFGAVGLMLVMQVGTRFHSEMLINRVCRNYEEHNVIRAFEKIDQMGLRDITKLHYPFNRQSTTKSVNTDTRSLAVAQRMLLRVFVPVLSAVVALIILLVINPLAIAGIILFAVVFVPAIMIIGRKAIGISRDFEHHAGSAARVKIKAIDDMSLRSPHSPDRAVSYQEIVAEPAIKSFMDIYEQRFNIVSLSGMVGGVVSAATVAIITAIFVWQAILGTMPWSYVILHFLALQFILQAIKRVSTLIVSLSRFYHQLSRINQLLNIRVSARPASDKSPELPLELPIILANGEERLLNLEKGGRSFLVSGERMNRFAIFGFINSLGFATNPAIAALETPVFVVYSDQTTPAGNWQSRGEIRKATEAILAVGCKEQASADNANPLEENPDSLISGFPANKFCFVFDCLSAVSKNNGVVFIDQKGLVHLSGEQVKMLLSHCSETFVLIYAFRAVQPSKFWETEQFITCNGQAVTGIVSADWVRENRQEFAELTKEASVEGGVGNDIDSESAMDIA